MEKIYLAMARSDENAWGKHFLGAHRSKDEAAGQIFRDIRERDGLVSRETCAAPVVMAIGVRDRSENLVRWTHWVVEVDLIDGTAK